MFYRTQFQAIIDRLAAFDERLARIESELARANESESSRAGEHEAMKAELDRKQTELVAIGEQGLHVVEMLDTARKELDATKQELERLKSDTASSES